MKVTKTKLSFGRNNLKKHLGLPFDYLLGRVDWWGDWMDHYKLERVRREGDGIHEDYVMLVSEPYSISLDGLKQLVTLCEKYGLYTHIAGGAEHNSGCCRIEIFRKYW